MEILPRALHGRRPDAAKVFEAKFAVQNLRVVFKTLSARPIPCPRGLALGDTKVYEP